MQLIADTCNSFVDICNSFTDIYNTTADVCNCMRYRDKLNFVINCRYR